VLLVTSISDDPFYLWCIQGIYGIVVAIFTIACGLSILRNVKVHYYTTCYYYKTTEATHQAINIYDFYCD